MDRNNGHGRTAGVEAALVDLEAANRRVSALAELSGRLSGALTREQAVAAIVSGAEEVVGATRAAFVAAENGSLSLVREDGLGPLLVDFVAEVGVPEESPVAAAARTGEMVLLPSPAAIEEHFPGAYPLSVATGLHALANVPIWLEQRVIGVLHLGFDRDHEFAAGEREFLLALSRLCAQALERADIFAWESRITRSLTEAQTTNEVAELTQAEARLLFGSEQAALYLLDPATGDLRLGGSPGVDYVVPRIRVLEGTAIGDAFWSGEPVAVTDQSEYLDRFPEIGAEIGFDSLPQALLAVPLRFRGNLVGAVGFGFSRPRQFSPRDMSLARGLADAAAAALERLRLRGLEQRALARQAAVARIARFALDASDQVALAQKVVGELVATEGAIAATIYLLEPETNELVRLETSGWTEAARAQFERIPPSRPTAATEALRNGASVYVEDSAEYALRWPTMLDAYRGEGLEAFACLQLALPDRVIGTMTMGFPERRIFDSAERNILETIASTAAQGLDRLRLREAERRAAARQAAVARIARFALDALDQAGLAQKVIDEVVALEKAASMSIYLLDADADELVLLRSSGWTDATNIEFARVPASLHSAATEVLLSSRPVFVECAAEYARRWPGMGDGYRAEKLEASAVLQLAVPGRVTGVISIGFAECRVFDSAERTTLETIAATTAQGLERLRAQDAERNGRQLLEAVVAQMPVGIRILSPDGGMITANPLAVAPWRGDRQIRSVVDYPSWPTFHSDGRPYLLEERPAVRALTKGEVVVDEQVTIERFDGTRGVLEISAAPVRDEAGEIIAGVVVSADITERREQEQSRDAFLALLSHELRTPMTSISAAAKLLRTRGDALDAATVSGLYDDVAVEADRLNRIVENLLVLSRVERDMVHPGGEPVLLGRLLPPRVAAEQAMWPDTKFKLHVAERLPIVHGDPGFIEHIVRNLLSNAAKYAPGDVEIDVTAARNRRRVRISVRDHGPGVSPAEIPHLFELFWRSPALGRTAPGAGVGLFVVRKLAEAMGGRVWLDETVSDGARFVVDLSVMDDGAFHD